jgi:hypothetical protein
MSQIFYLTNQKFRVEVKRGAFCSIQNVTDSMRTQFVLPGQEYGKVVIKYRTTDGELHTLIPQEIEGFRDSEPTRRGRGLEYRGIAQDSHITVDLVLSLMNGKLRQTIRATSISDDKIILEDIGYYLPCNTEFKWGEPAGSKVMGHHYIGGHSSHLMYTRCDGKGPYLLVLPQKNTKLEFFDVGDEHEELFKETKPKVLYAYSLSKRAATKAVELGTKLRYVPSEVELSKSESYEDELLYTWANDYKEAKEAFVSNGLLDVDVAPGLTVPRDSLVTLHIRSNYDDIILNPEFLEFTEIVDKKKVKESDFNSQVIGSEGKRYELKFHKLGENTIHIQYDNGKYMNVEFFVTEAIHTMIKKRGSFIASKQYRDESLWYNGLLAEWNNDTKVMLGPDNYDKIKGWRIYEVTCDDPGLSKPAFLSTKLAEYPVQEEIDALDYYIENFVWGGLQRTEEEEFAYGIYGIPDWHKNRNAVKEDGEGKLHIWRIYDYPHIALMYYNMYRVAHTFTKMQTKLTATEYLERAYRTALAMFTIPSELSEWSAYKTGLYNELVIENIIQSLYDEREVRKAERLELHWKRKIKYFVSECKDIFGSEYPFDTTGFESTHIFARSGVKDGVLKKIEDKWNPPMTFEDAYQFLENQTNCNITCRGYLEPAYYWYGSDYRANNYHYTLSYMSQMGGYSLLDYALHYAEEPFELLRLAYGSILSSWALLNSGDEKSNYGYWFTGKESDGAACGGFEPLPYGKTWLEQPHNRGAWYYSCEIDLGFCGAVRSAATIYAKDPVLGPIVYGGSYYEEGDNIYIQSEDGVSRRFHYVSDDNRIHMEINKGHFEEKLSILFKKDSSEIMIYVNSEGIESETISLTYSNENMVEYNLTEQVEENRKIFILSSSHNKTICFKDVEEI